MSIFNTLLRTVAPLALTALTGGAAAPFMTMAIKQIASQIAMQLIQNLGQQMGLPPSMINLAQAAFASASGQPGLVQQNIGEAVRDITQQMDLSPSQSGQLQRELMGSADKSLATLSKITDSFAKKLLKGGSDDGEEGGSILMKIARALGGLVDDKMNKLAQKAEDLGKVGAQTGNTNKDGAFTGKGSGEFGKLSAEVQALGQEIGYLSNALSTTLKSIGEAAATLARKG